MEENIQPEIIQMNIPEAKIDIKEIKWKQQGYYLIGTYSNGMKFGTRIDKNLRLIGIDDNNKPILKRIDI